MKILCNVCNKEYKVIAETPSSKLLEHDCKSYNDIMQQKRVIYIRIIKDGDSEKTHFCACGTMLDKKGWCIQCHDYIQKDGEKPMIQGKMYKFEDDFVKGYSKEVNKFLEKKAFELEPKTHCCECTPGDHYQRHAIHIQYPGCNCDPKKYVLKVND